MLLLCPFFERKVSVRGVFSGIFKSRDAPTNRTAGSAYSFFLGQIVEEIVDMK